MREKFPIYVARVRLPLLWVLLAMAVSNLLFDPPWGWAGWIVLAAGLACYFLVGTVRREPIEVVPPVRGRWVAVNSPADHVPSHFVHAYGQTYAIDLVHQPDEEIAWKGVHGWPPARPPQAFVGFGQPVYAAADGVVAKKFDLLRDHWSRDSWPGLLYVFIEGNLRELVGPWFILGNHVVIDMGNGVYAAYAHLRRGSVRVKKGQRVTAGEQIAECGNSGNSSEPHLHFQLMDHRSVAFAAGLPFTFARLEPGVPAGRQAFTATAPDQPAVTGA